MKIVAAHQNLSSSEQYIAYNTRLELPRNDNSRNDTSRSDSSRSDNSRNDTSRSDSSRANASLATGLKQTPPAQINRSDFAPTTIAEPAPESTSSDEQNEDSQQFNALLSVGAVKRILEQLTSGKLLSWIKGSDLDKIFAQSAQQQAAPAQDSAPPNDNAPPNGNGNGNGNGSTVFEMSYRYQQVSANFSGAVELADGRAFSWSFDLEMQSEHLSMSISQTAAVKDPLY